MAAAVEHLDGQSLADALVANHATLLAAESRELVLAAAWADLHPAESLAPRPVLPGMERPKQYGAHGTPEAGEFAAAELAALTGRSLASASTLIADALDLRHRHPLLWNALRAGTVRAWQARHIAARTRATGLTLAQASHVDQGTTPYLGSLAWGRFRDLLEARIITADPKAAEARRSEAELDRFVTTGQSNDHGLKTLVAKATAGEVIYLVAVVDRLADILKARGDTSPVGVRRSQALGLLAHPEHVLTLLAAQGSGGFETLTPHAPQPPETVVEEGGAPAEPVSKPPETSTRGLETLTPHAPQPPAGSVVEEGGALAGPVSKPPVTLYVHLSRDALLAGEGVARMEDVGPITLGQARELLAHSHVTLKPVIDLERDLPVDAYETPDRLREQLRLRTPASVFPWSPSRSRRMDTDHTTPYASTATGTGPPGQTRIANLGFLTRSEHRIKTHAPGWTHRQPEPGTHTWRTPHGYELTVDATGTHRQHRDPRTDSVHERALRLVLISQG